MRVRLMAVVLLLLLAGCSSDGGRGDGRITLRFQSLAWQRESVEATKELVGEWNATHPDVRVEYVQGSWDGVHDQLLTSFEGGEAPDIIHDASDDLADFAYGGYLADLTDLLPERLKSDIPQRSWETTTFGDGVYGVPFLQEPRVLVANATWLREAGVRLPTPEKPWSWDEFRAVTEELSGKGRYGVAWPLKEPVSATLNLSLSLGGRDVPPGRGRQGGDPLRRCRRGRPADRARPGEHRPQRGGHHARHGRLRHAAGVLRRPVRDGPARVLLPSADRAAGTRRIRLAGAARPGRRRRARPGRQSADTLDRRGQSAPA